MEQAPWFAKFTNYLASGDLPHDPPPIKRRSSSLISARIFGRSHSYTSCARMTSADVAYPRRRFGVWFLIIMTLHAEGMLAPPRSLWRCFRLVSIGPLYSRMSTPTSVLAIVASRWATCLGRMKCLSTSSSKLRYFIFGASTSWDLSRPPEAIDTFWLLWTTSPSRCR